MKDLRARTVAISAAIGFILATLVAGTLVTTFPKSSHAQLASIQSWAGTGTVSGGSLTLTVHNIAALNDLLGVPLRFIPSAGNTGAVTTTVNLDSGGTLGPVTTLRRTSNLGLQALGGAEFVSAQMVEVTYDGTEFVVSSTLDITPVGHSIDLRQSSGTPPAGYLIEDGTCYAQATYPALFAVIGSTYNANAPVACTGSQFAVPYSNGTVFAALDTQGSHTASRITSGGSGCAATAVGVLCGGQNQTLTASQLPSISSSGSSSVTVTNANFLVWPIGSGTPSVQSGTGASIIGPGSMTTSWNATGSFSVTSSSTNTGGSSHPILNPVLLGLRAIKY